MKPTNRSPLQEARLARRDLTTSAWRRTRGRIEDRAFDFGAVLSSRDPDDVLRVDRALQQLEQIDATGAALVELRFFGGLDLEAAADALDLATDDAVREWTVVRAWFRQWLHGESATARSPGWLHG